MISKWQRKWTAALLLLTLTLSTLSGALQPSGQAHANAMAAEVQPTATGDTYEYIIPSGGTITVAQAIYDGVGAIYQNYLTKSSTFTDWQSVTFAQAGLRPMPSDYLASAEQNIISKKGDLGAVTEFERIALGITAAGGNASYIGGYDLINSIYTNSMTQGNNALLYGLIAIDYGAYEIPQNALWTRDKLISTILSKETKSGGIGLSTTPDPDLTGMALTALAPYRDQPEIQAFAQRAASWLSIKQDTKGGYVVIGSDNSESVAQAIIGLTSFGIDPTGKDFTKNGTNLVQKLLSFRNTDGSFSHALPLKTNNSFSYQSVQALIAYDKFKKGEGLIYDKQLPTVQVEIYSSQEAPLMQEIQKGSHPLEALVKLAKRSGITLDLSNSAAPEIVSINDIANGTINSSASWRYAVQRAGEWTVLDAVELSAYNLRTGDRLVFFYSDRSAIVTQADVLPDPVYVGDALSVHVRQKIWDYTTGTFLPESSTPASKGFSVQAGELPAAVTDDLGNVNPVDGLILNEPGTYPLLVEAYDSTGLLLVLPYTDSITVLPAANPAPTPTLTPIPTSSPTPTPETGTPVDDKVTVSVTGDAAHGIMFPAAEIDLLAGDTPYNVLTRLENITPHIRGTGDSLYVWGINDLNEFDGGPLSGWMYSVNGIFPQHSAGDHLLQPGDVVKWMYTLDLGKDIGNPIGSDPTDPTEPELPPSGGNPQPDPPVVIPPGQWLPGSPITIDPEVVKQQLQHNAQAAASRYTAGADSWLPLAYVRAGLPVPTEYLYAVKSELDQSASRMLRKVTDYERMALVIRAAGLSPENFYGYNLIESIYSNERMTIQGTNGVIFGLIALDSDNYAIPDNALWTKAALLDWLLKSQNVDGSFPLAVGELGSIDMTAMAVTALAPHSQEPSVGLAVFKAILWLSAKQQPNGGFSEFGSDNSESVSQVLIALTAAGFNPASFQKANGNLLERLDQFQTPEGLYKHTTDGTANAMATEQALQGLSALERYANNKPSIYDMRDIPVDENSLPPIVETPPTQEPPANPPVSDPSTQTVQVTVDSRGAGKGQFFPTAAIQLQEGDNAYTILTRLPDVRPSVRGSGETLYVEGINGLYEFDGGPLSGWMYSVNGSFPNHSADIHPLKAGDVVNWLYTMNGGKDLGAPVPDQPNVALPGAGSGSNENASSAAAAAVAADAAATAKQILQSGNLGDWSAIGAARAGVALPASYVEDVRKQLTEANGQFRKVTDYERIALGLRAAGENPASFAGYNLIESIYNNERMVNQGTNGPIFALITLDSGNYKVPDNALWNGKKLLTWILDNQNADGSFPLAVGDKGSVDMTAMALTALATHRSDTGVQAAIDNGLKWLSAQQQTNGGFSEFGSDNSESVAQVIIALSSAGINPLDTRFVKNEINLVQRLASFRKADGSYAHTPGGESNAMATEQALLALTAYERFLSGKSGIYLMADIPLSTSTAPAPTPTQIAFKDKDQISIWAVDAVQAAYDSGLMLGIQSTGEPVFAPKQQLTRAQFATLLLRMLGEDIDTSAKAFFSDVNSGAWYYGAVATAYNKNIIQGSDGKFQPDAPVTRQDMAVMIARAFKLDNSGSKAALKDSSSVAAYAREAVQAVYAAGIMTGSNGSFHPSELVTREMAAVVASNLKKAA